MAKATDFIRAIINEDLKHGRVNRIAVRFPPEPNGYLHIGHAKSSTLNFGLATEYGGQCHLRFDDTNPATEDQRYVDAIKRDLRWLGFEWGDNEFYASDYFEQLYDWARQLIRKGLAYVDDSGEEAIRAQRGTVTRPGTESPFRNRTPEENLEFFARMKAGEFGDGERVLRATIDMTHPNMKMRDPLMYRIRHAHHYRRGDAWCIYPFYDWAHGQSDAIEQITHSICTLEFETNRVLYDWYLEALGISPRPHQYEFARLNMDFTITSKRKLLELVRNRHVDGWSDPRMPTLAGLRRRGVTPEAIRHFCVSIGTTKADSTYDPGLLEHAVRWDLNDKAKRVMCVLDPLPVTLVNWPDGLVEDFDAPYWPHDIPRTGTRRVRMSRELFIERSDFADNPPPDFRRLIVGGVVRLRHAFVVRCESADHDQEGRPSHLYCTVFRDVASAESKPRSTIHWADARHSIPVTVNWYDRLFKAPTPGEDYLAAVNARSRIVYEHARIEPSVRQDDPGQRYQFIRLGYFWRDPDHPQDARPLFNCIVPLRDTWAKAQAPRTTWARSTRPKSRGRRETPSMTPKARAWIDQAGISSAVGVAIHGTEGGPAFLEAASASTDHALVAAWMANHLLPALDGRRLADLPFTVHDFARLVVLVGEGRATTHEARGILASMLKGGGSPEALLDRLHQSQVSDEHVLLDYVDEVLTTHTDQVQAYHKGKKGLAGFFVGQVMRKSKGKVSPHRVRALVESELMRRA